MNKFDVTTKTCKPRCDPTTHCNVKGKCKPKEVCLGSETWECPYYLSDDVGYCECPYDKYNLCGPKLRPEDCTYEKAKPLEYPVYSWLIKQCIENTCNQNS